MPPVPRIDTALNIFGKTQEEVRLRRSRPSSGSGKNAGTGCISSIEADTSCPPVVAGIEGVDSIAEKLEAHVEAVGSVCPDDGVLNLDHRTREELLSADVAASKTVDQSSRKVDAKQSRAAVIAALNTQFFRQITDTAVRSAVVESDVIDPDPDIVHEPRAEGARPVDDSVVRRGFEEAPEEERKRVIAGVVLPAVREAPRDLVFVGEVVIDLDIELVADLLAAMGVELVVLDLAVDRRRIQ